MGPNHEECKKCYYFVETESTCVISNVSVVKSPGEWCGCFQYRSDRILVPRIPKQGLKIKDAVVRFELGLIRLALEKKEFNRAEAAKILGLNRTTLVEKIKALEEHEKLIGRLEDD